jgi:hypothetical protein
MPADDWTTVTGIRQSALSSAPPVVAARFPAGPVVQGAIGHASTYELTQDFTAVSGGQLPHLDGAARLTTQYHAAELDGWFSLWHTGYTPPLLAPNSIDGYDSTQALYVGAASYNTPAPLPLVGASYGVTVTHTIAYSSYRAAATASDIPATVAAQIPGLEDELLAGHVVQVDVVRVDGEVSMLALDQSLDHAVTVTAHPKTVGGYATDTPYSALEPAVMSVAAVEGATSATLTYPDQHPGDYHSFDFASDRVLNAVDPGATSSDLAKVKFEVDWIWDVRWRAVNPVILVCRWRQRNDGYGVTAAGRARTATSIQKSTRHRSYR